jgi:hypothetical protein
MHKLKKEALKIIAGFLPENEIKVHVHVLPASTYEPRQIIGRGDRPWEVAKEMHLQKGCTGAIIHLHMPSFTFPLSGMLALTMCCVFLVPLAGLA